MLLNQNMRTVPEIYVQLGHALFLPKAFNQLYNSPACFFLLWTPLDCPPYFCWQASRYSLSLINDKDVCRQAYEGGVWNREVQTVAPRYPEESVAKAGIPRFGNRFGRFEGSTQQPASWIEEEPKRTIFHFYQRSMEDLFSVCWWRCLWRWINRLSLTSVCP